METNDWINAFRKLEAEIASRRNMGMPSSAVFDELRTLCTLCPFKQTRGEVYRMRNESILVWCKRATEQKIRRK